MKLRVDPLLVQAAIAGALSFSHLHDLAAAAGQDGWQAWAYPVSVDLLMVEAWRRLRAAQRNEGATGGPWLWFVVALAASLGANVATAGLLDLDHVPAWLRLIVAGWPALAFLGGTLLVHSPADHLEDQQLESGPWPDDVPGLAVDLDVLDARVESAALPPAPAHRPEPVPAASVPAAEPAPAPAPEPAAATAPDVAPPAPEPVPVPAAPAPVKTVPGVPVALVDHARKVAADHERTTGSPIPFDVLRTRLGVPEPMARAIADQL